MWCEEACHVQDQQLNLLRSHTLGTMKPSTRMFETGTSASYISSSSSGSSGASPRRAALDELRLAFPTLPELNLHNMESPRQGMTPLSMLRGMAIISSCRGLFD